MKAKGMKKFEKMLEEWKKLTKQRKKLKQQLVEKGYKKTLLTISIIKYLFDKLKEEVEEE